MGYKELLSTLAVICQLSLGATFNISSIGLTFQECKVATCSKLETLYSSLLCDPSFDCRIDGVGISGLLKPYSKTVVLLYSPERLAMVNMIARKLSACGIDLYLIDVERPMPDLSAVCKTKERMLCMDITSVTESRSIYEASIHQFFDNCRSTTWLTQRKVPTDSGASCSGTALVSSAISLEILGGMYANFSELVANRTLKVTTVEYPPFVEKKGNKYIGVVFEILDKLAAAFHFKYIVVEPPDGEYGIEDDNGSFNGMIGMLQRTEADMAAAGLTVTYSRSSVADFGPAYHFEMNAIMINEPRQEIRLWLFVEPFQSIVWAVVIVNICISALILCGLHKCARYYMLTRFQHPRACFWYLASCTINQDYDVRPVTWSASTFLSVWHISALVLAASYSGNLFATLTTSRRMIPFQTFEELSLELERGTYKLCIEGGTTLHEAILNSNFSEYRRARNWLSRHPSYIMKDYECVDAMLKEDNVAYISELTYLAYYQKKYCSHKFIILTDRFLPGYFSLAFQKNSPLSVMFSAALLELFEDGLVDAWRANYSTDTDFCMVTEPTSVVRVGMQKLSVTTFGGIFLILAIGYATAVTMFVVERWFHRIFPTICTGSKKPEAADKAYAARLSRDSVVRRRAWSVTEIVSVVEAL